MTPAIEARLNDRQKAILAHILEHGSVTSGWCRKEFGVAYLTVYRDLTALLELGIVQSIGRGRSTKYVMAEDHD